jgi:hypothetical protein
MTMKTLRFGIEIETVGLRRDQLARAIQTVVGGVSAADGGSDAWRITDPNGRSWRVVRDASLSGDETSGEIVSPVLGYDDIEQLQNIVRAVRAAESTTLPLSTYTLTGVALTPRASLTWSNLCTSRSVCSSTHSASARRA